MTSPRRRPNKPVDSVELRISFRADRLTSKKIKEAIPAAVLKTGGCEVRIDGEQPGEVAEKAKDILGKLRALVGDGRKSESPTKDFKPLKSVLETEK